MSDLKRFAITYGGTKHTELYARDAADAKQEFAKAQGRSPNPIADFDLAKVKVKPL